MPLAIIKLNMCLSHKVKTIFSPRCWLAVDDMAETSSEDQLGNAATFNLAYSLYAIVQPK